MTDEEKNLPDATPDAAAPGPDDDAGAASTTGEPTSAFIRHDVDADAAPDVTPGAASSIRPAPVIVAVLAVLAIAAFSWSAFAYSQGQDPIAIVASVFAAPSGGERAKQSVAPTAGSGDGSSQPAASSPAGGWDEPSPRPRARATDCLARSPPEGAAKTEATMAMGS